MSVSLTVSKTLGGSGVADTLAGSSSGLDLGSTTNGAYCPIVTQSANSGAQNIYVRHNAVTDPITSFKTYVAVYSGTYGGADTAANDYATLKSQGNASAGNSANNNDGLESGLKIDMDWQVSTGSQFTPSRAQCKVYGHSNTDGIDLASAFDMHVDAMSRNNSGTEVDASAPVTGKIGKNGDTALGDVAHFKLRYYLELAATNGGIFQFDIVMAYSYTSAIYLCFAAGLAKLAASLCGAVT